MKHRLYTTIGVETAFLGLTHYAAYKLWYEEANSRSFHFSGNAEDYLLMDKAAHAFAAYQESYHAYFALRWSGVNHEKALWYGGMTGLLFQTYLEVVDGFYEGYGFSGSDMLANALGSFLFVGQQKTWEEQPLKIKFSFYPSVYSRQAYQNGIESLFEDYNAQTYWLSINTNKFILKDKLPDWLNIAIGYSTNNYFTASQGKYGVGLSDIGSEEATREFIFSLDIDFAKIDTKSKFLRFVLRHLNFIKFPFPALQLDSNGNFSVKGVYF